MKKYICGVDIGGTSIKIAQFDLERKLIQKWDITTDTNSNGKYILSDIINSIKSKMRLEEIKGIGIGVPGPVKDNVVLYCVNLGWENVDVTKEFEELGVKDIEIKVDNDANVAGLGETLYGEAKGLKNTVLVTLGTGVGGAIIINGEIYSGFNGAAGEIGHIIVQKKNGIKCNCGKKGCLETVASATGIVNVANSLLKKRKDSELKKYKIISAKKIIDEARNSDPVALEVMKIVTDYLGQLCAIITQILNPEAIIFGGGVSNAGDFLIDMIKTQYNKYSNVKVKILQASLGNEAGTYGAQALIK